MKKSMVASTFLVAALVSGCGTLRDVGPDDYNFPIFTLIQTGVKPFKVRLEVEGQELVSDKGFNSDCTAFDEKLRKACFVAEIGEMLELEFRLQQPGGGTHWRFTTVMICAGTEKPEEMADCSLTPEQQADFLVEANDTVALFPSDGTIDLTQFSEQLRVFSVRDFNWLAHDYVYWIEACEEGSTAEDDCAWMDPGGSNKGRGRY